MFSSERSSELKGAAPSLADHKINEVPPHEVAEINGNSLQITQDEAPPMSLIETKQLLLQLLDIYTVRNEDVNDG